MFCVWRVRGHGLAAVVAALALAAGAGAEYYGGGAMPQYGAADYEPDYHARSPDAPAPLDYKYQEEPHEPEKPGQFPEEDRRRKSRLERQPAPDDTEEELELESKTLESEARSGRRRRRRRGRGRRDEASHEPAPRHRRPPLPAARPSPLHDHYLDTIDYRDDRNKYEENERMHRETTAKVLGRKPRQRLVPPPPDFLPESTSMKMNEEFEEEEKIVRPEKNLDYLSGEESGRSGPEDRMPQAHMGRMRPMLSDVEHERPGDENEDAMREWEHHRPTANYPEYSDYQAMKNIKNIQNKIPTLLRRPTTTSQRIPKFSPGRVRPWPGRRAGQLIVPGELEPRPTQPAATSSHTALLAPTQVVSAGPDSPAPVISTTAAGITTHDTHAPVASLPPVNQSALSIADKSRLSIMKKAQMKEIGGRTTKKPPVLLDVTSNFPTVVMVGPATGDPWLRAREVAGDSAATLDKVKRLMRQKLVSGAKSIRDLTDDWDETICDYIDVGMLSSIPDTAARRLAPLAPLALLSPTCSLFLLL